MSAMLPTHSKPPSRRALLAGALGGLGAWAAGAIGRANPVRAEGEAIVVGGQYTTAMSVTAINNLTNNQSVFMATSQGNGIGVSGYSFGNFGVYGSSVSGRGVNGVSDTNVGVRGQSQTGHGVYGWSDGGTGVFGFSQATDEPAVVGRSQVSTGVQGYSGTGALPPAKDKTGVYGYAAQDSSSKGVWGESPSGYAGYFVGKVYSTQFYELTEIPAVAAPAISTRARLFLRDNAGKTQLCVRFYTGAVKVLATET